MKKIAMMMVAVVLTASMFAGVPSKTVKTKQAPATAKQTSKKSNAKTNGKATQSKKGAAKTNSKPAAK